MNSFPILPGPQREAVREGRHDTLTLGLSRQGRRTSYGIVCESLSRPAGSTY
jgi:hypothetical protein